MTDTPAPATAPVPVPEARKKFPIWLILVIIGAALGSMCICGIVGVGVLNLLGQQVEPKVFTASDNQSRVTTPGSWDDMADLNDNAEIHVGNALQEQYMVVLTESKDGLEDLSLGEYGELVIENLVVDLTDPEVSEPEQLTINGMPAVQYRVRATLDDTEIVYWVAGVEGDINFFQVIGWTLAEDEERNREVVTAAIQSLEELAP